MPWKWSDAGSASTGSLQGAKPETHFQTWSIQAAANLQIITVGKVIFAAMENGKKVLTDGCQGKAGGDFEENTCKMTSVVL